MTEHIDIASLPALGGFIGMCADGHAMRWHERNGGNLSYLLDENELNALKPIFYKTPREWVCFGTRAKNLGGRYFIVTGSGKYMKNVPTHPKESIGIVELNESGDAYRVVWGLSNDARPTSEFPTHILNHSVRSAATHGENRVIYHCHATNVIALSYVLPPKAKDFSYALWRSATECAVVFPEGVGVCPWRVPGGVDIALETASCMEQFNAVVWAQHGLFVAGKDFDTAFGLAHTIEKAAEIYLKVHSSGMPVLQTITDDDLALLAKAFGVTLKTFNDA